jgi:NADH dehydrogenase FAD-containing subunit
LPVAASHSSPYHPPFLRRHFDSFPFLSDKLIPATSYPGQQPFELQYDKLVIAVGAYSQTFGTPGVKEHAYFLKDIRDAANIRQRILECYELAAQPTVSDVERKGLLNFVIVGGGPTGVEFAGELHDFIRGDLHRAYPALRPFARISIYDVGKTILSSFDESLSKYATEKYNREGIDIKTEHHVTAVHEGHIDIKEEGKVPHGMVVWSTGLAPNSFVESITDLEHDEKTKSIIVDGEFRAKSVDGTSNEDVFVIGDCSSLKEKLPATAQGVFFFFFLSLLPCPLTTFSSNSCESGG